MALESEYQYQTYSRNVVLCDNSMRSYGGVDISWCNGVQFDVYLICEGNGEDPFVDLRDGVHGVIEVSKYDVQDFEGESIYTLGIEAIKPYREVFQHVVDPANFDTSLDKSWEDLAWDVVEWLLRKKASLPDVARRSRYGREPLL